MFCPCQIRNGEQKGYLLKNKELTGPTKGVIYLEIDVIYNTVSVVCACGSGEMYCVSWSWSHDLFCSTRVSFSSGQSCFEDRGPCRAEIHRGGAEGLQAGLCDAGLLHRQRRRRLKGTGRSRLLVFLLTIFPIPLYFSGTLTHICIFSWDVLTIRKKYIVTILIVAVFLSITWFKMMHVYFCVFQLLQQNFNRVKRCIMVLISYGTYINSCFEWESAQRSIVSFVVWKTLINWLVPSASLHIISCFVAPRFSVVRPGSWSGLSSWNRVTNS